MTTNGQPRELGHRERRWEDATSASMLSGAQHADQAAWARLVGLYAPLVSAWCRRWGVAEQDNVDIVQDVFAAVAAHLGRFHKDDPHDTFRGWLATISRNKVRDYYRRRAHQPPAVGGTEAAQRVAQVLDPLAWEADAEAESDPALSDPALGEVLRRALDAIRGEFHEPTWQAFWRVVVEGRSAGDVAAELNMQPGAVRVSKCRVLARLRQELGDFRG